MARSAALTLWLDGSTNCHLHFLVLRNALIGLVAWLSVTFKVGLYPFSVSSLKTSSNALNIVSSVRSVTVLELWSWCHNHRQ